MKTRTLLFRGAALAVPVLTAGLGLAPVAAAAAPAAGGQAALTAGQAAALSRNVTDRVIVVLRNQDPALPDTAADASARTAVVHSAQAGVVAELAATHATGVKSLSLVDAVVATVSPGEAARLRSNPAVAEVVKDEPIPVAGTSPQTAAAAASPSFKAPANACAPKGKVQLDPEAIETIHAATQSGTGDSAQALGYTGAGVKVAFIADGVDINNPDFIRPDGQHVFVDYQDFSGTGTNAPTNGGEAFLDSSSIAAQGREVYNLDDYGTGLTTPCLIRVRGVAPGASLVGLNVFGSSDSAFNSVFLEAIDYAVNHDHVQVINESFGSNPFPDNGSLDLTKMANDAAVAAGVTVTVSSGDSGVTNTIGSPATDAAVISAGASTTYRAYAQSGINDVTYPKVTGWLDNNISGLSSGGFAQDGSTVDIVAPGDLNWALCSPYPKLYAACTDFAGNPASLELSGGTSEAAPLTAGVAALVIQAYAKTHDGKVPSPAVVKDIIVSTAQAIGAPGDQEGAGLLDAYQAVRAAASYPGTTKVVPGSVVLDSATQFNAVGAPDAAQTFSETLTNAGAASETVNLSSRTLSPYTALDTRTIQLTKAGGYGATVTFTVPAGQARLDVAAAVRGQVLIALISPSGKYAENNLPQGVGNYGDAEVAYPQAGTWTALVSVNPDASTATLHFRAASAVWAPFGTLSTSSLTLAPGASGSFGLTVSTPSSPGDEAGAIVLRGSAAPGFANSNSIPVTLRFLVPSPDTSFTGTLTGGNGRSVATGQTAYYQVQVPAGEKALNAQISTANSSNTFVAMLVDPSTGEAASTAGNALAETAPGDGGGVVLEPEDGAQLHVLNPHAGIWTLIVNFYDTVSGTAVAQPFDVTLSDGAVDATASGLPDSTATQLPAGQPVTVPVTVTNNGTAPEAYFTDGRLDTSVTEKLASQSGGSSLTLPNTTGVAPTYLVPSHTTSLVATAQAPKPLFFDFSWFLGDPDVISSTPSTATTARGSFTGSPVASGDWFVTPFLTGPTGVKAFKPVTATTSLTATTAAFDPAVSSPTGDLWATSADPTAGFSPYVVEPGQTVTIPVTITPQGPTGSVVTGVLYLDDASLVSGTVTAGTVSGVIPEASDVAAFPYSYAVK